MSSINDVLKEKFGVNGSNIAETLSKITHGEGGGSGSGGNWLTVNVIDDGNMTKHFDKTAGQIIEAYPFVLFCTTTTISEYPNFRSSDVHFGCHYTCDPDNVDKEEDHVTYTFTISGAIFSFSCASSSDYPASVGGK